MKRIYETPAGRSLSAIVILKRGRYVGKVVAHHGNSVVTVEVVQTAEAAARCAKALRLDDYAMMRQGRASGYGYDKMTAALADMVIDGHRLTDHCGDRKKPPASGAWPRDAKAPRGWRFANWSDKAGGWTDCYQESGLDYLRALGYDVLQVL